MSAKLPSGWTLASLSDVAEISPTNPESVPSDETEVSFVPMPAAEAGTGRMDPSGRRIWGQVKKGYKRFQDEDVLFAKITPCMENGKTVLAKGLLGGVGTGSTEFHVLRPNGSILPKLLMHYLLQETFRREAKSKMTGTAGQLRVPLSFLEATCLPVAPDDEQHRIVEAIESYLTRLDDAVATLERVQRNLKRYRASVLKAAVEGRLVPTEAELARRENRDYEPASVLLGRILKERKRRFIEDAAEKGRARAEAKAKAKGKAWTEADNEKALAAERVKAVKKYKEPTAPDTAELPELPEGWCWATLDVLAHVGTGATPKRGNRRYWKDGNIAWVTSAVAGLNLVIEPSEFVTEAAIKETNLTLYPPGTLVVAMYGEGKTRGKCAELAIEATTNQALAALVSISRIFPQVFPESFPS